MQHGYGGMLFEKQRKYNILYRFFRIFSNNDIHGIYVWEYAGVFSCVETGKMWCLCFAIMENSDGKPVFIRTNSKIWNWCCRSIDRILLFQVYMGSIFILVSVSMCRCVLSGYIENISLDQWNRDCNCGNVQRMGTDTCQKQYYGRETAICHRL